MTNAGNIQESIINNATSGKISGISVNFLVVKINTQQKTERQMLWNNIPCINQYAIHKLWNCGTISEKCSSYFVTAPDFQQVGCV